MEKHEKCDALPCGGKRNRNNSSLSYCFWSEDLVWLEPAVGGTIMYRADKDEILAHSNPHI